MKPQPGRLRLPWRVGVPRAVRAGGDRRPGGLCPTAFPAQGCSTHPLGSGDPVRQVGDNQVVQGPGSARGKGGMPQPRSCLLFWPAGKSVAEKTRSVVLSLLTG